jgi:hypothetical protein
VLVKQGEASSALSAAMASLIAVITSIPERRYAQGVLDGRGLA